MKTGHFLFEKPIIGTERRGNDLEEADNLLRKDTCRVDLNEIKNSTNLQKGLYHLEKVNDQRANHGMNDI